MKKLNNIRLIGFDLKVLRQNSVFLVLSLFIAAGILAGVLTTNSVNYFETKSAELFDSYYSLHSSGNFLTVLGQTFINILPFVLISFVVGTSAAGCVLIPVIPFSLGFIFGMLSAYIYSQQGIMGIVFNLLILIPPVLIAFFAVLLSSRESFGFSKLIATMCIRGRGTYNLYSDFKNYCTRYLVILICFIFYALIDAVLSSLFIKFFEF